jgi:hypothetical protein
LRSRRATWTQISKEKDPHRVIHRHIFLHLVTSGWVSHKIHQHTGQLPAFVRSAIVPGRSGPFGISRPNRGPLVPLGQARSIEIG